MKRRIFSLVVLFLNSCARPYDLSREKGGGSGGGVEPNSIASFTLTETYDYDKRCAAPLVHSCSIETKIPVGQSVSATCTLNALQIVASTCLPAALKTKLLKSDAFSFAITRSENAKYLLQLTLSQGLTKSEEVTSLEGLSINRSEGEVDQI